jgi:hypothetical protein
MLNSMHMSNQMQRSRKIKTVTVNNEYALDIYLCWPMGHEWKWTAAKLTIQPFRGVTHMCILATQHTENLFIIF